MTTILTTEPAPLAQRSPDLPRDLLRIVKTAMAREADERFGSAAEFRAALRPFLKKP